MTQTQLNNLVLAANNLPIGVLSQAQINQLVKSNGNMKNLNPGDAAVSIADDDIAADAADDAYDSGDTDFATEGIEVGAWIAVAGFTTGANNGTKKVLVVSDATCEVDGDLTNEAVGDDVTISCEVPRRHISNVRHLVDSNIKASNLPS
jgi:hypothetical protein